MSLDPEKIFRELETAGYSWSDLNAAADILERAEKSLLSGIMLDKMQDGTKTVSKAEAEALASPAYQEHIARSIEARRLANRARVRYESLKTLSELRRTEAATLRTEMAMR